MILCPCHSGKTYDECCAPYHTGKRLAESALFLMRSRYSAYAKGLVDYIIMTTHPENPPLKESEKKRRENIIQFSRTTQFSGLEIVEFIDGEKEAFVTFKAKLFQNGADASFQEKSRFLKVNGKWLYHSGSLTEL